MLAKCTNPLCSASSRRLGEGTLFRLETDPILGSGQATGYFWLCEHCSAGMTLRLAVEECAMARDWDQRDGIVAAASSCPMPHCNALVIEYRATGSVRPDHPEDWGFTCPRCGTTFAVTLGELIFQSVPKQWLSSTAHIA